jgi:hypothetical protein
MSVAGRMNLKAKLNAAAGPFLQSKSKEFEEMFFVLPGKSQGTVQ